MRLYQILAEDISPQESIKHIIDIFTVQFPSLYRELKIMAEKYANNYTPKRGDDGRISYDSNTFMKSLLFIMGSRKSKWYNDVFFKSLKPALYNLSKSLPKDLRIDLITLLNSMTETGKFKDIEFSLIQILKNIAKTTHNQKLENAISSAENSVSDFYKNIDKVENIAYRANAPIDSDYDEPTTAVQPNVIGQQNAAVENIINDVLGRIDRRTAGEIRQAISRSGNKLQALQQELARRDLNP